MRKPCFDNKHDHMNKKANWSKEEDRKLIDYVISHGEGCWTTLPQATGLVRCSKSCKQRWLNHLKKGNFAEDEQDLIIRLHALLGNRWLLIAGRLPGRTDDEIKKYWNSHLKKKLINMGIDPNNHRLPLCISSFHGTNYDHQQLHDHEESSSSTTSGPAADLNLNLKMETLSSPTDLGYDHQ